MRLHVIFASFLIMSISLAGCISDSTLEQINDEKSEIIGCMEESALNYDEDATTSSGLCLSEEQLLLAEEMFWSSWDSDAVNNATEPVGYRLMLEEMSEDGNTDDSWYRMMDRTLDIQEVFAPNYYDQEIEYRSGIKNNTGDIDSFVEIIDLGAKDDAQCGILTADEPIYMRNCHYSRQTVFDNVVQVQKYSGIVENNTMVDSWDNYSMNTTSTYEQFRNRLEYGPGIRSTSDSYSDNTSERDNSTAARSEGTNSTRRHSLVTSRHIPIGMSIAFPTIEMTEFESIAFDEVEIRDNDRSQSIHYFAKDTTTGNEVEVMGEMTENGFKITGYCNAISNTNISLIDSLAGRYDDIADADENQSKSTGGTVHLYFRVSAQILLLEVDGNDMSFQEHDYDEPLNHIEGDNSKAREVAAIPFYFEVIPDSDSNETQNKSTEGRKGLNAVNVKVVLAGPSGPFGMEGELSDYRLVVSNCTLDSKTLDSSDAADDAEAVARSANESSEEGRPPIYGSDGNACTDFLEYDLSSTGTDSVPFLANQQIRPNGGGPSIIFVDADLSGTLSEGDRFEFSDNNTIFDDANMVRLYSISADKYSDENINPSSELSKKHDTAMACIRNIRSVGPDEPPAPVRALYDHNSVRSNRGS